MLNGCFWPTAVSNHKKVPQLSTVVLHDTNYLIEDASAFSRFASAKSILNV